MQTLTVVSRYGEGDPCAHRPVSATHGADYSGAYEDEFQFAPGEQTAFVEVTILDDDLHEGGREQLRIEIWSDADDTFVRRNGLTAGDTDRITASMFIEDDDPVLKLTSIDSGFQMDGQPDVSLGYTMRSMGDLNGDLYGDFAVGAPVFGSGSGGRTYILYGGNGVQLEYQNLDLDQITSAQGIVLTGTVPDGFAGRSFAASPMGAESPIVVVAAPGQLDVRGRVYVLDAADLDGKSSLELSPSTAMEITLASGGAGDDFGRSVLIADLDGNDVDDLVVVPNESVQVIYYVADALINGSVTTDAFARVITIINSEGTGFGTALAAGDFDGDGLDDLVVGTSSGNRVINSYDVDKGAGGFVTVIRGSSLVDKL